MRIGRFGGPLIALALDAAGAAAGATTMLLRKVDGCWLVDGREDPAR